MKTKENESLKDCHALNWKNIVTRGLGLYQKLAAHCQKLREETDTTLHLWLRGTKNIKKERMVRKVPSKVFKGFYFPHVFIFLVRGSFLAQFLDVYGGLNRVLLTHAHYTSRLLTV